MSKHKALVIGSNRGIGLEFCRVLKSKGFEVHGACRFSTPELEQLGITVHSNIDVKNQPDLIRLGQAFTEKSLDLVIFNSGILYKDKFPMIPLGELREQFEVNAIAPLMASLQVIEKIKKGGKLAFVTSRMGSIADNSSGGYYGYRASKAALNAIAKCLSIDLRSKEISVGLLHPGYVKTRMTEFQGDITPQQSAEGMYETLNKLNLETTGGFWHCNGESLPW